MSSYRSIRKLAQRANLTSEDALKLLADAGLPYSSPRELVSHNRLGDAELILGIRVNEVMAPVALEPTRGRSEGVGESAAEVVVPTPYKRKERRPRSRSQDPPGPLRHQYDLPIVGHPPNTEIRHLDAGTILNIHYELVRDFAASDDPIDPPGARENASLLESAVTRPKTSLSGRLKYPTIEMAAAALLHALVHDHPFHNGNKRTGIVALLVFLDLNGYILQASEEELFDYVLRLAAHRTKYAGDVSTDLSILSSDSDKETIHAAEWIVKHSRKLNKSQSALTWRDLETILRGYGCDFEKRKGNSIAIRRGDLLVHTGARNQGNEMDAGGVAYIRKGLELDEEHGVDSLSFYFKAERVPVFINKYRQLLRRLASY